MRNSQAAHAERGRGLLVWVVLGAAFLTLLVLAWPAPAQAQVTPVCPAGGPGPAAPHTTCRPLCETSSAVPVEELTVAHVGLGTFAASALNPYGATSGNYLTRGEPDCAVRVGFTDVWNVSGQCGFHCVHWHTSIPVYGVPVVSTTLVTPTAGVNSFFTGWTSNCSPSATKTVDRNVCSIVMDGDKTITATFAATPDPTPPTAPVLSYSAVHSYDVTLSWTAATDGTWLGGYEIYRNGFLYSRVGPLATSAKLINQFCQSDYAFEIRSFDSSDETPSNTVNVHTGKCIPAKPPNTQLHVWPQKSTKSRSAYFHWGANRGGVHYQCKLDKGKWKKCKPGKTYRRLKVGKHTFRVRAIDLAGADRTPAKFTWTIRK